MTLHVESVQLDKVAGAAPTAAGQIVYDNTSGEFIYQDDAGQKTFNTVEDLTTASTNTDLVLKPDGSGGAVFGATPSSTGQRIINAVITPAILIADVDDWSPTGLATCNVIRMSSTIDVDVSGIVAQPAGATIFLFNIGTSKIRLVNRGVGSIAVNRFFLKANLDIELDEGISIWYDSASSRWRALNI